MTGYPPYLNFRQTGVSFNLTPEQAVAFFQAKGLQPTFAWQEMLGDEHTRAFTVAKMMDVDMLKDTRALIDQAISEGRSMEWFKKEITPYLQKKGWWGKQQVVAPGGAIVKAQLGSPSRLATIFRTNMQSAYAAGQWDKITEQAEALPYLVYDAIDDHRTRPEHAAWDDLALPVGHPFWQTHYPPNGWNCRCGVIQVDDDGLEALGKSGPDPDPPTGTYKWRNPATGKWHKVPDGLDPGWDYNPGAAYQQHLNQVLAQKMASLPDDMVPHAKAGLAASAAEAEKAKVIAAAKAAQKELAKAEGAAQLAKSLERAKAKAALFSAEKELAEIAAKNPPYLGTALKQASKTKSWDELNPIERLGLVHAKAVKIEESAALAHYKQAIIKGKKPSAKAQAAFDVQPDEIQSAIKADIAAKSAAKAAQDELDAILAQPQGQAHLVAEVQSVKAKHPEWAAKDVLSQAKAQAAVKSIGKLQDIYDNPAGQTLKHKAYKKMITNGTAWNPYGAPPKGAKPWALLEQIETIAAQQQAKASLSAKLSGFKKKVLAGKKPSPSEQAAFNTLSADESAAFLKKIDDAKMKAAQTQVVQEETIAASAATAPDPVMLGAYKKAIYQGKKPTSEMTKAYQALDEKAQIALGKEALADKKQAANIQKALDEIPDDEAEAFDWMFAKMEDTAMKGPKFGTQGEKYLGEIFEDPELLEDLGGEAFDVYIAKLKSELKELHDKYSGKAVHQVADDAGEAAVAFTKPKAVTPAAKPPDADNMHQIGPQKGSNQGGLYEDTDTGEKWYLKFPADEEIARNEVLASKLYAEAGIEAPELHIITRNGKTGVASRYVEGLKQSKATLTGGKVQGVADGFVTDAWLANWDVAGAGYDNLLIKGNKAVRIDVGGALRYRAQGSLKGAAFGKTVPELDSLLKATQNTQTASVFNAYSKAALDQGALRVMAIDDSTIRRLVDEYGPKNAAEANKLKTTLIARKRYIAKKYEKLSKAYEEARAAAITEAREDAAAALAELDQKISQAVKGIAYRQNQGVPLEAKDLQRANAAREELAGFLKVQGDHLTAESRAAIEAYYEPWISDLQDAVKPGAGKPAKWTGGWFKGYDKPPEVDVNRVKVEVFTDTGGRISKAQGNKILKDQGISTSYSTTAPAAFKDLDDHHIRAIRAYTGSHYGEVNRALRSPGATPRSTREYERLLNQSLAYSKKYAGESTRGITLHGDDYKTFMDTIEAAYSQGKTWSDKGFMSTSKGARAAFSGNIRLHFEGKTGVWVKPISLHPSENEVLFGTDAKFLVTQISKKGGGEGADIYLTEVLD